MKKIISMIIAVSVLLSLCVVTVDAATVSNPTINVYATKYDGVGAPDYYKPGDYDVYKITYTVDGIDYDEDAITGLQFWFSIDDDTKIASKSWAEPIPEGRRADLNGYMPFTTKQSYTAKMISKGYYAFGNPNGIELLNYAEYSGGPVETLPFIESFIYVTKDASVTFTYTEGDITINSWDCIDTDSVADERKFDNVGFKVNNVAGNTAVLGAPASKPGQPPTEAVKENAAGKTGLKDLAGNDVPALSKNYGIAKFEVEALNPVAYDYYVYAEDASGNSNFAVSDGTITDKTAASKFKINFGSLDRDSILETEGDVSFYAIVRSSDRVIKTITLIKEAK